MENASKALIIAGAILLSILIIALGMKVYNNASSSVGQSDLSSQEISAHNQQFLSYEGRVSGAQVRSLVNAIRRNNAAYKDRMIDIAFSNAAVTTKVASVTCCAPGTSTDPNTTEPGYTAWLGTGSDSIKSSTTYFVTFGYMENGCIGGVDIHIYSDTDL